MRRADLPPDLPIALLLRAFREFSERHQCATMPVVDEAFLQSTVAKNVFACGALNGSTGDSSSKDSSEEEMESFGTLTHSALQSDDGLHEYAEALLSAEASNSMDVS